MPPRVMLHPVPYYRVKGFSGNIVEGPGTAPRSDRPAEGDCPRPSPAVPPAATAAFWAVLFSLPLRPAPGTTAVSPPTPAAPPLPGGARTTAVLHTERVSGGPASSPGSSPGRPFPMTRRRDTLHVRSAAGPAVRRPPRPTARRRHRPRRLAR